MQPSCAKQREGIAEQHNATRIRKKARGGSKRRTLTSGEIFSLLPLRDRFKFFVLFTCQVFQSESPFPPWVPPSPLHKCWTDPWSSAHTIGSTFCSRLGRKEGASNRPRRIMNYATRHASLDSNLFKVHVHRLSTRGDQAQPVTCEHVYFNCDHHSLPRKLSKPVYFQVLRSCALQEFKRSPQPTTHVPVFEKFFKFLMQAWI